MVVVPPGLAGAHPRRPEGHEGVRQRRLRRPRHAGAGARQRRPRPGHGRRDASTSSRRSARPRSSRAACGARRSSWPGRACWSSRTRPAALRRRRAGRADLPRCGGARGVRRASTPRCWTPSSRRSSTPPATCTSTRWRPRSRSPTATGLPPEVVYLYNGPGGIATFDATLKPPLVRRHEHDVPYLKAIGATSPAWTSPPSSTTPTCARRTAPATTRTLASTANPAPITGTDAVCGVAVDDPATARELWLTGDSDAPGRPPPRPACCGSCARRATGRCAPPTCPTPSPAPAGSPTSPSGCATRPPRRAPVPALHHRRTARDAYRKEHPERPISYAEAREGGRGVR